MPAANMPMPTIPIANATRVTTLGVSHVIRASRGVSRLATGSMASTVHHESTGFATLAATSSAIAAHPFVTGPSACALLKLVPAPVLTSTGDIALLGLDSITALA